MSAVNDIQEATRVAIDSLKQLSENAKDITVEEAIIEDGNIEVTLSYSDSEVPDDVTPSLQLLSLLGERRKWRVFIIDKIFKTFKGFKTYNRNRK